MQEQRKISEVFRDEPCQWGLRGDPYLWNEIKDKLGDQVFPTSEEQFVVLLEQAYQQLTNSALANQEPIYIEHFAHGGMSSGYVDPKFWSKKCFPYCGQGIGIYNKSGNVTIF